MYGKSSGSVVSGARISRAFGPQSPRQAYADVTSVDRDRAVAGSVLPDPGEIVPAEGRAGDDPEAIGREPRDREVAFDPAPRVQHLRVRDRADVPRNTVVAEPLEQLRGALARYLDLRERRLVEERRGLATGAVLGADRRRPVPARPAAWAQALVAGGGVRLEPVRALPAGLLAEGRSESLEARIRRREAQRPPSLALVPRVLDVVVRRIDLRRAGDRVLTGAVRRAEAARVHLPDVEARRLLDDPFRDQLPHSRRHRPDRGRRIPPRPRSRARRSARG